MDARQLNGKKLVNGNGSKRVQVLSTQKMKKLEQLGFDADLVELIHRNWKTEKQPVKS